MNQSFSSMTGFPSWTLITLSRSQTLTAPDLPSRALIRANVRQSEVPITVYHSGINLKCGPSDPSASRNRLVISPHKLIKSLSPLIP